jgi:hypothetical protein
MTIKYDLFPKELRLKVTQVPLYVTGMEWELAEGIKVLKEICPSATLSTTIPIWPELELNPHRHGGKPVTNDLSYGMAYYQFLWKHKTLKTDQIHMKVALQLHITVSIINLVPYIIMLCGLSTVYKIKSCLFVHPNVLSHLQNYWPDFNDIWF